VSGLVEAARFDNRIEAELARLNLEAEGLDAVLFDAEMNSFGWGPLMPIRLMVIEEDLAEARRLLGVA
jgi:Putative prokaryotic signal transducing protein